MIDFMTFWPFRCPQITLFYFWWHFERENGHIHPLHKSTWNENWPKPFQNGLFHDDLIIISISSYSFSLHECQRSFLECFPPFSFSFLYSLLESDRVFFYDLKLEYQAHKKKPYQYIPDLSVCVRSTQPFTKHCRGWGTLDCNSSSECFVTWIFCVRN